MFVRAYGRLPLFWKVSLAGWLLTAAFAPALALWASWFALYLVAEIALCVPQIAAALALIAFWSGKMRPAFPEAGAWAGGCIGLTLALFLTTISVFMPAGILFLPIILAFFWLPFTSYGVVAGGTAGMLLRWLTEGSSRLRRPGLR